MTLEQIKNTITQPEYNFLAEDKKLSSSIILLGLGGSHAYGTNVETSDLDIRGIATNSKRNILTGQDFEQIVETKTDTIIYSVEKMFNLLYYSNPNIIEILGLKPEHYLVLTEAGKLLLDNKDLFLSQLAIKAFAGYANDQIRRAECKQIADVEQKRLEEHVLNSIEGAMVHFNHSYPDSACPLKLYIDDAVSEGYQSEIFMDADYRHVSLREFTTFFNEMTNITREYSKLGKRNKYAMTHDRMSKHLMHTVRLMYMVIDMLENKQIVTYREKEHDILMDIRNGKFVDDKDMIIPEFYDFYNELEARFKYAKSNTDLPLHPDKEKVYDLLQAINEKVISSEK